MKSCKRCKEDHPLEDYLPCNLRKDGRANICKECRLNAKKYTVGALSRKILKDLKKEQKKRKKTPQQLRRIQEEAAYQKHRKELLDEMFEEHGYYFCQHSGERTTREKLECHHIIFRSELRGHPEKHNKKNLILLSKTSHDYFEKKKSNREYLVKERNLESLYGSRISFYQNINPEK